MGCTEGRCVQHMCTFISLNPTVLVGCGVWGASTCACMCVESLFFIEQFCICVSGLIAICMPEGHLFLMPTWLPITTVSKHLYTCACVCRITHQARRKFHHLLSLAKFLTANFSYPVRRRYMYSDLYCIDKKFFYRIFL